MMGVVDSEDIPLNLSREMLQNNPLLRKVRKLHADKILNYLHSEMKKDSVKYADLYSLFLKEGIVTEMDHSDKESIAKLMLFESSNLKAANLTNLSEYCKRMQAWWNCSKHFSSVSYKFRVNALNSLGVVPLHVLDVSPKYLFRSAFSKFLELKELFMALRAEKAKRLWFSDFDQFGLRALQALETEIVKLARSRRFVVASALFVENVGLIKKAIFHCHRYVRAFFGAGVSRCVIAWIALVWCYLTSDRAVLLITRKTLVPYKVFSILLIAICYSVYIADYQ